MSKASFLTYLLTFALVYSLQLSGQLQYLTYLLLTYYYYLLTSLQLSGQLQYMIRQSAMAESFMTSVERLCYFASSLPQEEAHTAPAVRGATAEATSIKLEPSPGPLLCPTRTPLPLW